MNGYPTVEQTNPPGARPFSDFQSVRFEGSPYTAALDQSRVSRSGPGFLGTVTVSNDSASKATVKVYDSTTASGVEIMTITVPAGDSRNFVVNASFYSGLTFAMLASPTSSVVVSASVGNV